MALEQLEMERLEKKHLQNEIKRLKQEIHQLNNPPQPQSSPHKYRINKVLQEAEDAMNRFSEKIRKETAKYAKQKQSKG